jgi:phenylalanyl-tRNA synthetase beta chain
MKISLNWLMDYVDIKMGAGELAARLMACGLNCDEVVETANDVVLDLEVTSNRPDCLGHIGVAREVAAITGEKFKMPHVGPLPAAGKVGELTSVTVDAPDLCPRYTARVIRGVKVGKSPDWMVERLEAIGMRSINNIVDVTNYVLMEYSQPLHSFDLDKLAEHRIVVRRARGGEQIVSIDQTRCQLDESMLVIADARRAVAVAGIMGGLDTEVADVTTNVLIESAQFDPLCIRRTARKLALMSESNYRFERGVDPVGVGQASLRVCQLILALAGGQLAEGIADVWANPYVAPRVTLRPERANALLGIEIPVEKQVDILSRLGLSPRVEDGRILCTIPPYRADLTREADLIEEVIRLHGYDKIPTGGQITHKVTADTATHRIRRQVAETASAGGFDEVVNVTFIDTAEGEMFSAAPCVRVDPLVRKTNNLLRPTLLPSLLRNCKVNQDAGTPDVSIYEMSAVFPAGPGGKVVDEHVELAMATTRGLAELRGTLEAIVDRVAPEASLEILPAEAMGLDVPASAEVRLNGKKVGSIGVAAAAVKDYYGLSQDIFVAAIRFNALVGCAQETRIYKAVPRFPAVRRDISLVVDESVTWRELSAAIAAVAQPLRVAAEYVTTYRGKPIPEGRKSVTVTLVYRSNEGTLRGEQVDEAVAEVVEAMKRNFSAELRA